jgi:hypothetical protein
VPRGKIVFHALNSPRDPRFRSDPEGVVRDVMKAHNAVYIERSLHFAPGGRVGHALFETIEPDDGPGSKTDVLGIGKQLDAIEIHAAIDPDRWKREFAGSRP